MCERGESIAGMILPWRVCVRDQTEAKEELGATRHELAVTSTELRETREELDTTATKLKTVTENTAQNVATLTTGLVGAVTRISADLD